MRWENMMKAGIATRGQTQPYARSAYGAVVET